MPSSQIRCAAVLLRICGLRNRDDGGRRSIALSHDELAQMTGIGRQTAARSIAAIEARGLIRSHYGSIELVDPAKLRQLIEEA